MGTADASRTGARRPRLGVFKLASCDGCQLTLLDCEDELLHLAGGVDIAVFNEATSRKDDGGPLDLVLVEGSVSTPDQVAEIRAIRARARYLVAIGACATAGGIQALRNFADAEEYRRVVYARPEYVATLARSTAIAETVPVDFELRGCPIDRRQLLDVIGAFLAGRRPSVRDEAVCAECKRAGHICVIVAHGKACLGPVTHAGCGALCPGYLRGCYGCYGPKEEPNNAALATRFREDGSTEADILRAFRFINGWSPGFRDAAPVEEASRADERGEGGPTTPRSGPL